MRRTKQAVKIQDVARTAGVSVSTVSRVLNGKVDVAEETQARIQQVIDQLGYTSSLAARSMRGQKNNLIGLIMPDIAYPFAIEVMKGVNQAVAESDYDLLVFTTGDIRKYGTASQEQKYVSLLNNSITDGVIIAAPAAAEFSSEAPIISIDPLSENPNYPAIHATNYEGSREAMRYLLGLGHRQIGFIGGRPELTSAKRREKGYRNALEEAGIALDETLIINGDYTTETGFGCARQLLERENRPTAIFAANDQSAIGVIQAAQAMGLSIPADLSVIGFDNITDAAYFDLTTIDQFISQMGYQATKMLLRLINGEVLEQQIVKMKTCLVVRGSCRSLMHLN
ncbi:MAG: LacI family transcriptional regulator [Chloroflexi bacterium HGW-Chloroflexi-6]|nr:MAG: LacI family transcriptional regulator [Chloroflexi bacterium HGW-Chloroflexi-6]